jgi:sigma-B regulation protein RsbU (phosphoserine phosphatase)
LSEIPAAGPLDPVVHLLGKTDLFRGLPDGDLRRLATLARRQRAQAGQVLVEAGAPLTNCFVVGDGTVDLSGPGIADVRGPGDVFGQAALLGDGVSEVTARARDAVELVAIPGDDVRRLLLPDSLATRILRLGRAAPSAWGDGPAASMAPGTSAAAGGKAPRTPAAAGEATPDGALDDPAISTAAVSRAMQRMLLPRNAPRVTGYDIAAGTTAEDHGRGNTLWDAIPLPDGRTAVAVLDIRADGQPAALLLGMTRAALRVGALAGGGVADLLARANTALSAVLDRGSDQFVECALAVPGPDGVEWGSAGRLPAGVLGRAGTLDSLTAHGPPLGMMEGFRYGEESVSMGAGDALLVLSSGTTGLFRGAADLVAQVQERTAGDVVATVHRGLRKAQGEQAPEVSVLFLRKH